MTRLLIPFLLALCVAPASAAPGIFNKDKEPTEQTEPAIIRQANTLAQTDRMEAIALLEDYLADGTDPELLPWVALNAGEQRRLAGDMDTALAHFQRIARDWPQHGAKHGSMLGMALVAFETGKASGNTTASLGIAPESMVPDTMNADRYRLMVLEGTIEVVSKDALVRKAFAYAESDPVVLARVNASLGHLRPNDVAEPELDPAMSASAADTTLARANSALASGDLSGATAAAESLISTFPDSELVAKAEWVKKKAAAGNKYSPTTIGVLLPLTGQYAPPGKQLKLTLEMGRERIGGVRFIYKDTAADPDQAKQAFEDLVLNEGVAAVIGPLTQGEAEAVAGLAQDAEVPLITLTQTAGITDTGEWTYQAFVTPKQQVESLLRYTMGSQGMDSFSILAPDSDYGRAARDAFMEEVTARGGKVEYAAVYDPTKTDYRSTAGALKKGGGHRVDAIFIPDNHRRAALIASALAYEDLAVGSFDPKNGAGRIRLLGLSGWNNAELGKSGGKYVQLSYFVDAYYRHDPTSQAFHKAYRSDTGRSPNMLDAVGYDTGRLIATTAALRPASRQDFSAALATTSIEGAVASGGSFGEDREIERRMYVFTINYGGNISLVDPPLPPQ